MDEPFFPYIGQEADKISLAQFLSTLSQRDVIRHFLCYSLSGAPITVSDAILVGLDTEWWEKARSEKVRPKRNRRYDIGTETNYGTGIFGVAC